MQPFLQTRLERYARRLGELDFLLSREDIMGDMGQYRLLSREHAEVTQIAGRYARWQQCNADLAGAREMLHDPDMAEMAQEEIASGEQELIKLAHEIAADKPPEDMTEDEFAFYEALRENESAVRDMGDPVLKALAHELTDKLRKSATIDWQKRDAARARMRLLVKVLLTKYKYPPDKQPEAVEKVIEQAELYADLWAFEGA